ncbi:MAG: gliding motility-associated C-terminal domain-containing protein [Saprospiraceae bacterium]|nr:gliding motility-associated C-terminal domain-containing protein [Saprospiraceae bacterium]
MFRNPFLILNKVVKFLSFYLLLIIYSHQFVYANDPCSAIPVPNNGLLFTTYNLSSQGGSGIPEPICGTYNDPDIWFSFVAPPGGSVTIEVKGITATDPAMAIYSGDCNSPDLIGCYEDQKCGNIPDPGVSLVDLIPGTTYFIRVWNELPGGGTFKMRILDPNTSNFTNSYNAYNTSPNCVQLTTAGPGQKGCSWYNAPLDFDQPFEIAFTLFFGDLDADGADGICLVFSTAQNCGGTGGGIGALGIPNSLIIEFDTWYNGEAGYDDIPEDHTSIHVNGDFTYSIAGPVALPNIEDGVGHPAVIDWDPATLTLTVYLDGAPVMTLNGYDVVANCFNGTNEIYWGWTASTGGSYNNQSFCYESAVIDNTAPINEELNINICNGDSYTSPNGNVFTTTGTYTEDFVASNGCNSVRTINLEVYPQEVKLINTTICKGDAFNYNGQSYSSAGDFTVNVDGIPCDTIVSLHIEMVDFLVNIFKQNDIDCNNSTTQLLANVVDQSAPLFGGTINYEWTTTDGNIVNGQGTDQITVDKGGTYWLRITTSNGLSCEFVSNYVQVMDNTQPPTAIIAPQGALDCSHASIVLDGSQSSPGGLLYNWSTTNGNIVGSDISSTILIDKPGDYTLIIENLLTGCKDTTQYKAVNTAFNATALLAKSNDLNCKNLTSDLTATISNADSTHLNWSTTNGHIVGDSTGTAIKVDKAGTYKFSISDDNGCQVDFTINVAENTVNPAISASPDSLITCTNPNLTIFGSVNTPDSQYVVTWKGVNTNFSANSDTIKISQPDQYIFTVTDTTNHCISIDTVNIGNSRTPPDISPDSVLPITCKTDSVALHTQINNYKAGYTFAWSSNNPAFNGGTNDSLIFVTDTGFYQVTVTNPNNGCTSSVSFDVVGSKDQPIALAGGDDTLDCILPFILHNGSFTSGQPSEIKISWTTTDGSITGSTDQAQVQLAAAGTYIMTVINSINQCSSSDTMVVVSNSDKPVVSIEDSNVLTCKAPSINLTPHWSNAGFNPDVLWSTVNGNIISPQTDSIIQVDKSGDYVITVTNPQNGCLSSISVFVDEDKDPPTGNITPPDTLNCTVLQTNIDFNANNPDYIYNWSTTTGMIIGTVNQSTVTAGSPGLYNLMVTDTANGCTASFSQTVLNNVSLPVVSAGNDQVLNCKITSINLSGTVNNAANYDILWAGQNGGNIVSGQNTLNPTIDQPGTYILTIKNLVNSCINTDTTQVISKVTHPQINNPTVFDANCFGKNGSIRFENITDGDAPYQFKINGVVQNNDNLVFNGLDAGDYLIEGEDNNGCYFSFQATINQSDGINFILPDTVKVEYGQDYTIIPEFLFDTLGMHYLPWVGADYLDCNPCLYPTISPTYDATLTLSVTDKDGCPDEQSLVVRVFKKSSNVFVPNIFSPDHNGINDKVTVFADSKVITEVSEFRIFNRWGAEVFLKKNFPPNDENEGWDGYFKGKMCNPGVYVYYARCKNIYGEEILYKGSITILN